MHVAIAIYIAFAFINYRVAVLLLAPWGLFLGHFPAVDGQYTSIFDLCCLGLTVLLPIKTNIITKIKTYPFLIPTLLVLVSYCTTNLLAETHWPSTIIFYNTVFLYPLAVWSVLEEKDDLRLLLISNIVFFALCAIYALVELALDQNIILETIIQKRMVNENVLNYTEVRFGIKRIQSVFCTPMSMGLAMTTFAYVLYEKYKMMEEKIRLLFVFIVMCFILPWLTGARSVFVSALIILIPVLREVFKDGRFALLKIGIVGLVVFVGGNWILTLIDSFVHSDTAVAGSSLDMRLMQFAVIVPFFLNSPIWGNGYAFIWTFVKAVDKDILGAESIWIQLLVDYGLLGALAYLSCIVSIYRNLTRFRPEGKFLPLAIIVGYTLSTFLELEMNFFFIMSIILIKLYTWNDEENARQNIKEDDETDINPKKDLQESKAD